MSRNECRKHGCGLKPDPKSRRGYCSFHETEYRNQIQREGEMPRCECGGVIPLLHQEEGIELCRSCYEKQDEANRLESMLDDCTTFEELKDFIREHLLGAAQ